MAIPYADPIPGEDSDFSSIRDSFYLLMNLNQYKMKPVISMTREAEGLLRIVLFSKDLKLVGTRRTLSQMRLKLARELRNNRRRGVVPVFISTLWFVLALAISIEAGMSILHMAELDRDFCEKSSYRTRIAVVSACKISKEPCVCGIILEYSYENKPMEYGSEEQRLHTNTCSSIQ